MSDKITLQEYNKLNQELYDLYNNADEIINLNDDICYILLEMRKMIYKIAKKCDCFDFEIEDE